MINLALVNNAPETSFDRTTRLFARLFEGAARAGRVRLHPATLPGRPPVACAGEVLPWDLLVRSVPIHGLIVTGAEPTTVRLEDEPFWPALCALFDWAERRSLPLVLSCLAAQASVLHFDGIRRTRLQHKRLGVFRSDLACDDPLTHGMAQRFDMPHSRWNTLDEDALASRGYRVLARSCDDDVDMFVRRRSATMLHLQGHPEYAPRTLLAEHRRDVDRYLRGLTPCWPGVPAATLNESGTERLARYRRDVELRDGAAGRRGFPALPHDALAPDRWSANAAALLGNWLDGLAGEPNPQARAAKAGAEICMGGVSDRLDHALGSDR